MIKPFPMRHQSEGPSNGQSKYATGTGTPRRVSVNACEDRVATIVVPAAQGNVWMSILPPFTWDAIMEPRTVDEVIRVLELARDEAMRMTEAARERQPGHRAGQ